MISKEEFRKIESEYNTWLAKHPKGDHNYKSFSHMRRSIEFAKYYSEKNKNLTIPVSSLQLPTGEDMYFKLNNLLDSDFEANEKLAKREYGLGFKKCYRWITEYVKKK